MAEFMAGWAHHQISRPSSAQHVRSQSSTGKSVAQTIPNRVSRAISTSALHTKSSLDRAPPLPTQYNTSNYNDDDENLNTIPDPRSRAMTPANADESPSPNRHPDLTNEVATLSNKLINAINHQTNLDATLSSTRHELETSRERIRQLELESEEHADQLARGILLKSSVVRAERAKMNTTVAEEKAAREEADKAKKKMELELENLTAALFEEANKMVITAREEAKRDQDLVVKKNDQLKAQIADTESLLKSHQEQLAELKQVMEQMSLEQDDATNPTAPSTPGLLNKFDSKDAGRDSMPSSAALPTAEFPPSYPTSFTHLLTPVLRTDLAAYDDFTSLLRISKIYGAGTRVSSGSYGGLGIGLGLGSYGGPSSTSTVQAVHPNGSHSSLSSAVAGSPVTPTTPASTVSAGSQVGANALPLKETRFYKRALAEDIEPTLRLDTAPGLSWLARRSVLNAMCEGTMVVEPMPQTSTSKLYTFACSLCGEARKNVQHARTHRFRTSESENAQRYPLCKYCLGRVRSCCDFLGFLRVLKDGHWRTDDEESEKVAWEESVRLREQMFWCRMGGGVVPAQQHGLHQSVEKSPRTTSEMEREKEMMASLQELERTGDIRPRDVTPSTDSPKAVKSSDAPTRTATPTPDCEEPKTNGDRLSQQSLEVQGDEEVKRLSITIPGSFDS